MLARAEHQPGVNPGISLLKGRSSSYSPPETSQSPIAKGSKTHCPSPLTLLRDPPGIHQGLWLQEGNRDLGWI